MTTSLEACHLAVQWWDRLTNDQRHTIEELSGPTDFVDRARKAIEEDADFNSTHHRPDGSPLSDIERARLLISINDVWKNQTPPRPDSWGGTIKTHIPEAVYQRIDFEAQDAKLRATLPRLVDPPPPTLTKQWVNETARKLAAEGGPQIDPAHPR